MRVDGDRVDCDEPMQSRQSAYFRDAGTTPNCGAVVFKKYDVSESFEAKRIGR
jgi:hypothetical protein